MRTARVIITKPKTHDGLGGKYGVGDTTPPLPYANAAKIVSAGRGQFVDAADSADAEKVVETAKRRGRKRTAATRMELYDDLPPEIRALAQEHGNEVVELFLSGESAEAIREAYNENPSV